MFLTPITAVAAKDPYPWYRGLVARRPVYRDDALGLWVVANAAAVSAILSEPRAHVRPPAEPVPKALAGRPAGDVFGSFARMTDGPAQAAMKQAIRTALAGVTQERVSALAREWLSRTLTVSERPDEAALNEILFALPVSVMAGLLGVPTRWHRESCGAVAAFVGGTGATASARQIDAANDAASRLLDILRPLLDERDGVLPALRGAAAEASPAAVAANALGFLFQTHDATAGLVGNTLLAAARQRDAYRRAVDEGRLQDFVAEVLRFDPSVHNTRRFVVADCSIAGHDMRAGDAVLVVLAAANHDAAVNESPERFDIDRSDRRSFTFGAGRHACPGEIIATSVASVAAEVLAPTLPELDDQAERVSYRALPNVRIPVFRGLIAQGEAR
jgi:cytochrome P450